jgi:hypothetical protein
MLMTGGWHMVTSLNGTHQASGTLGTMAWTDIHLPSTMLESHFFLEWAGEHLRKSTSQVSSDRRAEMVSRSVGSGGRIKVTRVEVASPQQPRIRDLAGSCLPSVIRCD